MDYRRVELAKFVEHGRPWAANGPKLQKKRVLCIRSEHLRLQASQELTFTFKDAGRAEHTGRHSLQRRAASATRATAARGATVVPQNSYFLKRAFAFLTGRLRGLGLA